jgi:hypothetical protein
VDCSDCFEEIDDARECLRECNNLPSDPNDPNNGVSLLEQCLDTSSSAERVQDIGDLADCCDFSSSSDNTCEDTLTEVAQCLNTCMDFCLTFTAGLWYLCVSLETGKKGCSRGDCIDGFLEDLPNALDVNDLSTDIFDVKNLERRLKRLKVSDLEDCSSMEEFVDEACRVGDECCDVCQPGLASTLDCLMNDVLGPFVAASLNETIPECPVAEDCSTDLFPTTSGKKKNTRHRGLTEKEADLFNKAIQLPQTKRHAQKEAFLVLVEKQKERRLDEAVSSDPIADCQKKMQSDVISYNMTHAANNYLVCINAAAFAVLEEDQGSAAMATPLNNGWTTTTLVASILSSTISVMGLVAISV